MTTLTLFKTFTSNSKEKSQKSTQEKEQVQNQPQSQQLKIENDQIFSVKKIREEILQENPQIKTDCDLSSELALQMNKLYRMRQFRKFSEEALIQQNEQENIQQNTTLQKKTQNSQNLQKNEIQLNECKDSFVNYVTEKICMCQEQIKQDCNHAMEMNSEIMSVSTKNKQCNNKQINSNKQNNSVDSHVQGSGLQNKTDISSIDQDNQQCLARQLKIVLLILSIFIVTFLYIPILLLFIFMALAHSSALSLMNIIQCKKNQPSFIANLVKYYKFQKQRVVQLYFQLYKCFYP